MWIRYSAEEVSFRPKEQTRLAVVIHIIEEAPVDQWKDFSARHGHCLEHYRELLDNVEQERRARVVLANLPYKTAFFAPALAALGRLLVGWGFRLRARYDKADQ